MNRFQRNSFCHQSVVLIGVVALWLVNGCAGMTKGEYSAAAGEQRKVIIYVWDGLRPDSVNPTDTPNLHEMRESGVDFTDNHSTYPTFTMMNAASFATGGFPGSTGYYGNTVWQPGAKGPDSANAKGDFQQPVFTE